MARKLEAASAAAEAAMDTESFTLSAISSLSSQLPPSQVSPDDATCFITRICDDTLLRIFSYTDLPSLVYFSRGTSHSLRHRFHRGKDLSCPDIWREAFTNHNFAPVDVIAGSGSSGAMLCQDGELFQTTNYFNAIRERLSLWSNLSGNSLRRKKNLICAGRKATTKQCFSLPSRMFHFIPLVPPDMMKFPPVSESNNNDISFSYLDNDGASVEDGDGHINDMSFELDPNENIDVDNNDDFGQHSGTIEFDPPPVEFACDSFSLTSPGTGQEFVLLNPFSGSVEVYGSILDNAISSDESMLEQAMLDASEGIMRKRRGHRGGMRRTGSDNERSAFHEDDDLPDENSEVIAGEAIHNHIIQLEHKIYDTPPRQVLFSVQDYFDLDLKEYFGEHTPFARNGQHRERQGSVTADWVGVDSHIALRKNDSKSIAGNVIGAARILTMESEHGGEEELACTDIFAWSNFERDLDIDGRGPSYDFKYVCRAAGSFYFLDICPNYNKVYAAFQSGCCPFQGGDTNASGSRRGDRGNRQLVDIEEESMVNDDGEPIRMNNAIYCLPLVQYSDSPSPEAIASYFPAPDACIVAQYPVASFSVDPTGQFLVIGTICGTVEIWHTGVGPYSRPTAPLRLQILSVRESFMKRNRAMTMDERHTSMCGGMDDINSTSSKTDLDDRPSAIDFHDVVEAQDDLALIENGTPEEVGFPHKHPTSKISQVYLPRHLLVHQCGFVTKQRSPESGTTLLLWQTAKITSEKTGDGSSERFHVTAMINLPLSSQCHPEVHFDGRRLIVFGKDHIGILFLVYHVLGTRFDQNRFEATVPKSPKKISSKTNNNKNHGEESGGVVQIAGERRIKFVNRIRHAGLGGLEYYDSMLLSANERFLLVNTKAGNLVGSDGARNASEGLIVIDLQEYGCY